jgi:RNA-binding protein
MELTSAQRKWLRGRSHALEPVVRLGKNGLTEGVLAEIDGALASHELIKVQAPAPRAEKEEIARRIEEALDASLVGLVGHVLILFRRQDDPELQKIDFPKDL